MGAIQSKQYDNYVLCAAEFKPSLLHQFKCKFLCLSQKSSPKHKNNIKQTKKAIKPKYLPLMPRCSTSSSMELLRRSKSGTHNADEYFQFKIGLDERLPLVTGSLCVFDISGIQSGQKTPQGFPAYTLLRRPQVATYKTSPQLAATIRVKRKVSLRIPALKVGLAKTKLLKKFDSRGSSSSSDNYIPPEMPRQRPLRPSRVPKVTKASEAEAQVLQELEETTKEAHQEKLLPSIAKLPFKMLQKFRMKVQVMPDYYCPPVYYYF